MYHIVCFPATTEGGEEEVEIIYDTWLQGKERCFFPPFMRVQLRKALENKMDPKDTWKLYSMRIIKSYDTYEKALRRLPMAELTSNLESEQDEIVQKRKKKKSTRTRKQTHFSESDDDDGLRYRHNLPLPPLVNIVNSDAEPMSPDLADLNQLITSNNRQNIDSISCSQQPLVLASPNVTRPVEPSYSQIPFVVSPQPRVPRPDHTEPSITTVTPFERAVIKWMEKIDREVRSLSNVVNQMIANNSQDKGSSDPMVMEDVPNLPLRTVEEMNDFEAYLQNSSNFNKMVINLSGKGGHNVQDTTKRVFNAIMSHELLSLYNWAGRGKLPFKSTISKKLIIYAVRKNKHFENASEKIMEEEMKSVMKYAPLRVKYAEQKK